MLAPLYAGCARGLSLWLRGCYSPDEIGYNLFHLDYNSGLGVAPRVDSQLYHEHRLQYLLLYLVGRFQQMTSRGFTMW